MERLGLDVAKTLARELDCEVRSYSRHGRYGGIVIVRGTYDPAFMQSLLRKAADLCSARGYPAVVYLVGGASTASNAKAAAAPPRRARSGGGHGGDGDGVVVALRKSIVFQFKSYAVPVYHHALLISPRARGASTRRTPSYL